MKGADRLVMARRQQVRIAGDERDRRPAAVLLQSDQILVERIVPARPGVAQIVRRERGIEAGTPQRSLPGGLDLPAIAALAIDIGLAMRTEEHRAVAMWQIGKRG